MNFIYNLEKKLQEPLPGRRAQSYMAVSDRIELNQRYTIPEAHRKAAVLNLLHFEHGHWRTVLMRRTINQLDKHSGQISFPGGSMEESDANDPARTALREAEEEIGVATQKVRLLGALSELYVPVSNFLIYPYVGVLVEKTDFIPQASEAMEILRPTIRHFSKNENQKRIDMDFSNNRRLKNVPYFDVDGHVVWGATAMIIAEFMALVNAEMI